MTKPKIAIFGTTGMLGNHLHDYLKTFFTIVCINRDRFDILKNTFLELEYIFSDLKDDNISIVINCVGLIPQVASTSNHETYSFYTINSVFPRYLSILCHQNMFKFVHITTDCVFTGMKGRYTELDCKDETGIYGMSKSLGESIQGTIIRTSIIGHQRYFKGYSLLEWVIKNKSLSILGFTNHFWNGVTCLQLAKIIVQMVQDNLFWSGVRHVFSNTVSKYELVNMINEIYNLEIGINPFECTVQVDRTLNTVYEKMFSIPCLRTQLMELCEWRKQNYF